MSKISFGPETGESPAPVIDVAATSKTSDIAAPPAPETMTSDVRPFPEGSLTPVQYAASSGGLVLGDTLPDFRDVILPRLNLVQGVGNLKDSFPQGALIYNQSTVLFTPPIINKQTGNVEKAATPPVNIVVIGLRPTRYCEKIVGGERGLIVNSEAEVRASGGTLDYREFKEKEAAGMKRFEPLVDALVAIERPDHIADDDTVFTWAVTDADKVRKYALAIWGLKGVSYTAAAKAVFFTQRMVGCLKGGYPTHAFALSTRLKSFNGGKNSAWVPVPVPTVRTSPAFLEFVKSVLNPAPAATDEAAQ